VLLGRNGSGDRASGRVKNSDAITTPGQNQNYRRLSTGNEFDAPAAEKLTRLNLLMIFRCV
jgi:hypothetical protein